MCAGAERAFRVQRTRRGVFDRTRVLIVLHLAFFDCVCFVLVFVVFLALFVRSMMKFVSFLL